MRKTWAGVAAGMVLVLTGCTINTYHVMKAENNYYVIPLGDLPANDDSDLPDSAVTYLTKQGTHAVIIPRRPPAAAGPRL